MEEEILYNITENAIELNCIGFDDGTVHSGILSFCTVSIVQYSIMIKQQSTQPAGKWNFAALGQGGRKTPELSS
jgi:hypothetical protein